MRVEFTAYSFKFCRVYTRSDCTMLPRIVSFHWSAKALILLSLQWLYFCVCGVQGITFRPSYKAPGLPSV